MTIKDALPYSIIAVEGMDGAGKSTLVRGLNDALSQRQKVLLSRPARQMSLLFRSLVERAGDDSVLYQHVLPAPFRHATYLFEASVQFRYQHDTYAQHDVVLFDRWQQTWEIYCAPIDEFEAQFQMLRDRLPRPDLLFYVRVDPAVAYQRLVARSDRWCRTYSPADLLTKLQNLNDAYERQMAAADVAVLDGNSTADEVLKSALEVIRQRELQPV